MIDLVAEQWSGWMNMMERVAGRWSGWLNRLLWVAGRWSGWLNMTEWVSTTPLFPDNDRGGARHGSNGRKEV